MKKCSKSHHHALAELNITPLLDLAFVLLIIFVITTPLLEKGMSLQLGRGGVNDQQSLDRKNLRVLEINKDGTYLLEHVAMPLDQVERRLRQDFQSNKKLVVYIRGDKRVAYDYVLNAIERCRRNGITTFSLRTQEGTSP